MPGAANLREHWDERISLNTAWKPTPVNLRYVRKFFEVTTARKIPTYLVVTPLFPRVQRGRETLGLDARYDREVLDLAAEYPGVVVLDGRRMGIASDSFTDAEHLDRDGAAVFSTAVSDALLTGVRRGLVHLSPGPSTSPTLAEDGGESSVAVERVDTLRR